MTQIINLYLCTTDVHSELDVLSKKMREDIKNGKPSWIVKDIPGFKKAMLLILPASHPDPKWKSLLDISFPEVETVPTNRTTGALLYLSTLGHQFVIPFGTGYFALDETKLVGDFGLMITANEVLENSLRFLDSNNPSVGTKARVQSDRLAGVAGFDLDSALAFIKKLGGVSENSVLGKSLAGSSGIKLKAPAEISLIQPTLAEALKSYGAQTYKERGLEIITSMKPVTVSSEIQNLDQKMVQSIRNADGDFVISCPVIVEWDVVGFFRYGGWRNSTEYQDLDIDDYTNSLTGNGYENWNNDTSFLQDMRSKHVVVVLDAEDGKQKKRWPIYRCFQGSLEHDGKRYAFSDGRWFSVSDNFKNAILETYQRCRTNVKDNEFPTAKLVTNPVTKAGKTTYVTGLETEEAYNLRAAGALEWIFLDKQTGSIAGIANQKNELCDILSHDLRLVHVKKGSRTSGQLHHLFRQGATAARMLRDPQFLSSVATKLRAAGRNDDAAFVATVGSGTATIEFRIIDKPRSGGNFDIPFFAKVALHYAEKEIRTTGAKIALGFIDQE